MAEMQNFGCLEWIGIRPARRAPLIVAEQATLVAGTGIVGDHYLPKRGNRRQVTLICSEHLAEIAHRADLPQLDPAALRRNLVISHLPLTELIGRRLRIGDVQLELTGPCSPCARMDEVLGPGKRSAMSGRGGVTAVILHGGTIRKGDTVESLEAAGDTETSMFHGCV